MMKTTTQKGQGGVQIFLGHVQTHTRHGITYTEEHFLENELIRNAHAQCATIHRAPCGRTMNLSKNNNNI